MSRDQGEERGGDQTTAWVRLLHALSKLRRRDLVRATEEREALGEAVLVLAGQVGVEAVTVERLVAEAGLPRLAFYRHFAEVDECFRDALSRELDRLADDVLAAASAQAGWEDAVAAGLEEAARLLNRRPNFYRGLLVEGHRIGAPPDRERTSSRLAAAIDSRRAQLASEEEPPAITAAFVVATYEYLAISALRDRDPRRFAAMVPELAEFAARLYPAGDRGGP